MGVVGKVLTGGLSAAAPEQTIGGVFGSKLLQSPTQPPPVPGAAKPKAALAPATGADPNKKSTLLGGGNLG